jgi:hypothetical protein
LFFNVPKNTLPQSRVIIKDDLQQFNVVVGAKGSLLFGIMFQFGFGFVFAHANPPLSPEIGTKAGVLSEKAAGQEL